jgi:UDP-2,3-diacylglucosamine pyrophosphatase LpxH
MRFLRKDKVQRTVLVISDIHLGAGLYVGSRRNPLEDFHYDQELVEFLQYYSQGEYYNRDVELIINGDLFDLLAVPFVSYFDDEFWSEDAALAKLKMILKAHPEVIEALAKFCSIKKKKIVYIIGNHDAEFVFDSLQKHLIEQFPIGARENFEIHLEENGEYIPIEGIVIKHGHEYELAHHFHPRDSIVQANDGKRYFIPPWGSYYVTRVLNKFKEERHHINAVRPVGKFIVNGFIYDPLITFRFGLASTIYFFVVRFISLLNHSVSLKQLIKNALTELELFRDYEQLTQGYFAENENVKALIVGHTHEPIMRTNNEGKVFINTGTWTNMYHLDFGKQTFGPQLTYAKINVREEEKEKKSSTSHRPTDQFSHLEIYLNVWEGQRDNPFREF